MQHWRYFLMLEEEILSLRKYIEFDEANYNTYSLEICKQLGSICSEVDTLFKDICFILGSKRLNSINKYQEFLKKNQKNFELNLEVEKVNLWRSELTFSPFCNLYKSSKKQSKKGYCEEQFEVIDWWKANNGIKHNRVAEYKEGNLKNLLNAASALFILNLLHAEVLKKTDILPANKLFTLRNHTYASVAPLAGGNGTPVIRINHLCQ